MKIIRICTRRERAIYQCYNPRNTDFGEIVDFAGALAGQSRMLKWPLVERYPTSLSRGWRSVVG